VSDIALVTGASGGLGGAIAGALAEASWSVVGVHRPERSTFSDKYDAVEADLLDQDAAKTIREAVHARGNRVAVLINNAGAHLGRSGTDSEAELFELHWRAPRDLVDVFEEDLRATRGAVVNISSTNAFQLDPAVSAYSASKLALCHLTRLQALHLAPDARVNAVLPGLIDAGMTRQAPPDLVAALLADVPFARLGSAAELASVVNFLASSQSAYLTGQLVEVDGGQMLGRRGL
jgi:NAD(P)-dependent dehydrogenase (short-subunit alcohol dehydrogenase family)